MTHYEVFRNASKEVMARLLTSMLAAALGGCDAAEIRGIYLEMLEFLGQEAV